MSLFKRPGQMPPQPPPGHDGRWAITPPHPLWALGGLVVLTYVLFQQKLLPEVLGRRVAKLYFWPTMPLTLIGRWDNFFTTMDDTLILGGAPMGLLGHPDLLYKLGVRGVVNMCDEYGGPQADYRRLGIRQLRLATVDHSNPSARDVARGVRFIHEGAKRGEKVLVHCKAGHGRSAAVAMAWLLAADESATPESVQRLMLARRHVRRKLYKQSNVLDFYAQLQQERRHGGGNGRADGDASPDALRQRKPEESNGTME